MEKYKEIVEVLSYDEISPSYLRWNDSCKIAGTVDSDGYWVVRYKGKGYKTHRVILAMFNKLQEDSLVDHIDGNRDNNHISNLRCVSKSENTRNCSVNKKNTSGQTGVSKQNNFWRASWSLDSKSYAKLFDIRIHGDLLAFEKAVEFRNNKIKELNQIGLNYTERHGNERKTDKS